MCIADASAASGVDGGAKMDAVDWSGLSVLAALFVACVGYLSRQIHREVDGMRSEFRPRFDRVDERLDRLEERYVRHLELHARR